MLEIFFTTTDPDPCRRPSAAEVVCVLEAEDLEDSVLCVNMVRGGEDDGLMVEMGQDDSVVEMGQGDGLMEEMGQDDSVVEIGQDDSVISVKQDDGVVSLDQDDSVLSMETFPSTPSAV